MNYDLLAAFDHPGVDPAAQQQAANLLSPPSQIQPPSFSGGAGLAEGRPEYISPQAPYVNPVNYAAAGGTPSNNQIAMDAFAAAQAAQQQGRTSGFEYSAYEQPVRQPQSIVYNRNLELGRFSRGNEEGGRYWPGVGATVMRGQFGTANPNGSRLATTNMAGHAVPFADYNQRMQAWLDDYYARENYRRASRMAPFLGQFNSFSPDSQLDSSQVVDARQWRRPQK